MNAEPSQPAPERSLRDELAELIYTADQLSVDLPWDRAWQPPHDLPVVNDAFDMADSIMQLLNDRGHYLPGMPPAARILQDAQSFAERLTLAQLALRILNMLAWPLVEVPEAKGARRWIEDYMEGRNHGPTGYPMLWPRQLPGMAAQLRSWGFQPTPTQPAYVARALPSLTIN